MDNKKFTIGCDPEMFCVQNGKYIAVQNCNVAGTKESPQQLPQGGCIQRDNVAVEFNVIPAYTSVQFIQHVGDTIMDVIDFLPKGVTVDISPSANFSKDQLVDEECKAFGCMPDWNAWTMEENKPPKGAKDGTFRSCGGHVCVGYVANSGNTFLEDLEGKAMTIRGMDILLGLPATVLDNSPAAIARRELYGAAGCFRPTPYGVEYRTLSNFWIKSPKLVGLIYSLVKDTLALMRSGETMGIINHIGGNDIQTIITNGNRDRAEDLVTNVVSKVMSDDSLALYYDVLDSVDDIAFYEEWKKVA